MDFEFDPVVAVWTLVFCFVIWYCIWKLDIWGSVKLAWKIFFSIVVIPIFYVVIMIRKD